MSDKNRGEEYFESQLKVIAERYGKRIVTMQNTKVIGRNMTPVATYSMVRCVAPGAGGGAVADLTRNECPLLDA